VALAVVIVAAGLLAKPWVEERRWIDSLRIGDEREREIAAEALGKTKSARAVPVLAELLRSEIGVRDPEMEWLAASEEPGDEDLYIILPGHGARYLKVHYAVLALGRIGESAVPALADCLRHPNALVRMQAAFALCMIGPEAGGAVEALVSVLQEKRDQSWYIGYAAAALGRIGAGANAALPTLRDIANMDEALRGLLWKIAGKIESASETVRKRAREHTGQLMERTP
jgi:HEAT repeat protein